MQEVLPTIVVVAKHGEKYIEDCVKSLGEEYPLEVIDTAKGGHPTGAYINAYKRHLADNYFFMQDSMFALIPNYLDAFQSLMPKLGAVAWGRFHWAYDNQAQQDWLERQYTDNPPELGIFGPVFYTNHDSLQILDDMGLLPDIPNNKIEAQGTERAWAWAFHKAGLPVESIDMWDPARMQRGTYPIFRKVFGGRA